MKVGVLGLGNWGTALCQLIASNGYKVTAWSNSKEICDSINNSRKNSLYLSEIDLHPEIYATLDFAECITADIILYVLPSATLTEFGPKLSLKAGQSIISCVKGLEVSTSKTPLEYLRQFTNPKTNLLVLSGPGFAIDIVKNKPAGTVLACQDEEIASEYSKLFSSKYFKVYTSSDTLGVELGGILKNVIALAAGVSDGLKLGDSARAGLITRGLAEIMRLAKAMGANPQTLAGLSGMGDLILTATGDSSRNRTVGLRLGRGESLENILKTLGSTAEAVKSAPVIIELAKAYNVDLPISNQVNRLLIGEVSPIQMLSELIARPTAREFD